MFASTWYDTILYMKPVCKPSIQKIYIIIVYIDAICTLSISQGPKIA